MKNSTRAAALCTTALVLSACGGNTNGGGGGGGEDAPLVNGGTFAMAIPSDPGSLDPGLSVSSDASQVNRFLYDTLTQVGPDGTDLPNLAEDWSATTTKAEFTLRPDITCGDGSELTASVVADNFSYIADEKNGSPLLGFFVPAGAKAKADDAARTVTVTSPEPVAFLLRNLSSVPIVCEAGLADRDTLTNGANGTGMFTLESRSGDGLLTLKRRDDYAWGPGDGGTGAEGLPDTVTIRSVESTSTAANLLLASDLNAAKASGPDAERLKGTGATAVSYPAVAGQMFFNEESSRPAASEDVRRALVTGIDLAGLRKVLTGGTGEPSAGMVPVDPPVCPGAPAEGAFPDFDPDGATAELEALGTPVSLKVLYPAGAGAQFDAAMEFVQSSWTEIGVEVELVPANDAKLYEILDDTGDWDISFVTLGFTLPSQMIPFFSGPASPDGLNSGHVENQAYVETTKEALTKAGTDGCDDWNAAEQALYERVDVVPFANEVRTWYANKATFELTSGLVVPSSIRMRG